MKKFSLFLSFLLAFVLTAKAQDSKEQKVVLVEDAATELTDGTVIALQSRDYSAGAGYYFAGASPKAPTFSANNLFVVEGSAAGGMKLRRFPNGKYIGKNGNAVTEVESAAEAATFTAQSYLGGSFTISATDAQMESTVKARYVRFFTDNTFLNTRGLTDNPNYASGTAGYSVWYVYRFPEYTLEIEQTSQIDLSFNRPDATADNVQVSVSSSDGSESDAEADFGLTISNTNSPALSNTEKFPATLLCPNVNIGNGTNAGGTQVSAQLTFTLTNLSPNFSFSRALLEIHALDAGGNYHSQPRYCDITLSCGAGDDKTEWSTLGNTNVTNFPEGKWWTLTGESVKADEDGTLVLTINITRGSSNGSLGFFVGLSGIKLIEEKSSENTEVSPETVAEMKIADVEDLLKAVKCGYESMKKQLSGDIECDYEDLAYKFPVLADGVEAENVVWPSDLNGIFSEDLENNFELLDYAQKAIGENPENLDKAKTNLADFIRICNKNFPVSLVYTATENYGTLYTPFAVATGQLPAGLAFYECVSCDEKGVLRIEDSNSLDANKAYIVKTIGNADVKTVQLIDFSAMSTIQENGGGLLKGTHTGMTAPKGSYVLQNQTTNGLGFYLVEDEEGKAVPAGQCYVDLTGETAQGLPFLCFPDGTPTAIEAIDAAEPAAAAAYDLAGRRVTTATRGLYIMGGRKVLVK